MCIIKLIIRVLLRISWKSLYSLYIKLAFELKSLKACI